MESRLEIPVYRDLRGRIRKVTGDAASDWPFPRVLTIEGTRFVEWPMPHECGWGITFHHGPSIWRRRSFLSVFVQQYAEGIASGFPRFSVLAYSLRTAVDVYRERGH